MPLLMLRLADRRSCNDNQWFGCAAEVGGGFGCNRSICTKHVGFRRVDEQLHWFQRVTAGRVYRMHRRHTGQARGALEYLFQHSNSGHSVECVADVHLHGHHLWAVTACPHCMANDLSATAHTNSKLEGLQGRPYG